MSAIGPGDWVECVDGGAWRDGLKLPARHEGRPIVPRHVYQVREVIIGRGANGPEPGLRFVGIRAFNDAGLEGGWPMAGFRPIYRPREDLIQTLLQPLPADVEQVTA